MGQFGLSLRSTSSKIQSQNISKIGETGACSYKIWILSILAYKIMLKTARITCLVDHYQTELYQDSTDYNELEKSRLLMNFL